MPIAQKFKALGAGNGFPHCLDKVDVSNYDYWTTFSGFNKNSGGSPTEQQIADSLTLGMKVFWNLHKMNATIVAVPAGRDLTDVTVVETFSDQASDELTPINRVSKVDIFSRNRLDNNNNTIAVKEGVVRMYLGDEFIGYGGRVRFPSQSFCADALNFSGVKARVFLGGYGDISTPSTDRLDDYAYITIGGVSYVCNATATTLAAIPGFYTASVDAANLTASCATSNASSVSTITGFEFYTYPET